jgi:hypothetical protein
MALVALASVTHHGGEDARTEIAKQSPLLVRIMREDPNDYKTIELAIVTLCHAIQAVLLVSDKVPDKKVVKSLGVKDVIDVTLDNIRRLPTSPLMVQHAIPLLVAPTMHCWEICEKHESLLNFLAACLRCSDIIIRCEVMGGFIRLHHHDAQMEWAPLDPQKLIETFTTGGFGRKPRVSAAMMGYGPENTDIVNTLTAAVAFQKAMQAAVGTKDLVQLGRTLAGLIVQTEFSISDGWYQSMDPKTGRMEATDVGLPFTRWRDALPICAAELRKTGLVLDTDRADILEIKYYVMTQNLAKAIPMAKAAVERNPDVAYYYYAVTLTSDTEEGLRYSKKGMKSAQITPFLKYCMMRRAVEFSCDQGLQAVLDPQPDGGERRELGFAFLQSAMEDSKEFMERAPPDSRHMEGVIDWNVLVTLTYKGPEISKDLRELKVSSLVCLPTRLTASYVVFFLKPAFEQRELAGEFLELTGIPHQKTFPILTARTVLDHYEPGVKEWGLVVERLNEVIESSADYEHHKPAPTTKEDKEHELAAWLNNLDLNGEDEGEDSHGCANLKENPKRVELYRCTHCGNPSAVLRKCKCNKVR